MSVTQAENGTWEVSVWYKDWQGERKRKHKRGFATKREAKAWESAFVARQDGSPDMRMHDFYELYREDQRADHRDQGSAVLRRDEAL
ncbi:Arm DNA-binding domain-containing protein [Slackia exigua]|nr:Arm DNA-binding domain-containing protein [Slackia exigua]